MTALMLPLEAELNQTLTAFAFAVEQARWYNAQIFFQL